MERGILYKYILQLMEKRPHFTFFVITGLASGNASDLFVADTPSETNILYDWNAYEPGAGIRH